MENQAGEGNKIEKKRGRKKGGKNDPSKLTPFRQRRRAQELDYMIAYAIEYDECIIQKCIKCEHWVRNLRHNICALCHFRNPHLLRVIIHDNLTLSDLLELRREFDGTEQPSEPITDQVDSEGYCEIREGSEDRCGESQSEGSAEQVQEGSGLEAVSGENGQDGSESEHIREEDHSNLGEWRRSR